jgi:hypothetical protein
MRKILLLSLLAAWPGAVMAADAQCAATPFTLKKPVALAPAPSVKPKAEEKKVAEAQVPKAPAPAPPKAKPKKVVIGCKEVPAKG